MSFSSSTSTITFTTLTSNSMTPRMISPSSIISPLSTEESDLIHSLSLLSESYRPALMDLIILSLSQSKFSIKEIEEIYFEDIITLGCRFVEQNESFRIKQDIEIVRRREERKLRRERIEIRRESFKSRIGNYILNIELIKVAVVFKKWFIDFGDVWKEDALSNWKEVKKQLRRIEANNRSITTLNPYQDFTVEGRSQSSTPGNQDG